MTAAAELGTSRRAIFREHYEREVGFVYNFLRRLGVGAGDVEDVAQEVFTSVYLKLDEYDRARPFRPWIAAFAVRCAAAYRRKAASRDIPSEHAEASAVVPSGGARREAHELLVRGLATLEDGQREVLVLHDLYGHSMDETAEILRIPSNTGYTRLRAARARFKSVVGELQREAV
jgi:RNA polymerase sigma-70 factor (ECF subfamily)